MMWELSIETNKSWACEPEEKLERTLELYLLVPVFIRISAKHCWGLSEHSLKAVIRSNNFFQGEELRPMRRLDYSVSNNKQKNLHLPHFIIHICNILKINCNLHSVNSGHGFGDVSSYCTAHDQSSQSPSLLMLLWGLSRSIWYRFRKQEAVGGNFLLFL